MMAAFGWVREYYCLWCQGRYSNLDPHYCKNLKPVYTGEAQVMR